MGHPGRIVTSDPYSSSGTLRAAQAVADRALSHLSVAAVVDELVGSVRQTLGAEAVSVWLRPGDGSPLGLVRRLGGGASADEASLVDEVRGSGRAVLVATGVGPSLAGAPLRAGDELLGVLTASTAAGRALDERHLGLVAGIADRVAPALDRALRLEAEHELRARAEAAEERARFLADAGAALTEPADFPATVAAVASLAVPRLADACTVDLVDRDGALVRHARAAMPALPATPPSPAPARDGSPRAEALRSLRPVLGDEDGQVVLALPLFARGRPIGVLGLASGGRRLPELPLARDFAGRAALALDNARLFQEAQAALRDKDEVLAVVSHDLRAPLTSLLVGLGLVERLAPEGARGEKNRERAQAMQAAGERMARLVSDLVDLGSLDAGGLHLATSVQPIAPAVREVARLLGPLAAEKELELAVALDEATPDVPLDRARIEQVLLNLLGNAIKFTPRRGHVRLSARPAPGGLEVEVADDGPGIPAEHQARIFERYYQVTPAQGGGAGLGLHIARRLVEAHGGRLSLASAPGRGTAFTLVLPSEGASFSARSTPSWGR